MNINSTLSRLFAALNSVRNDRDFIELENELFYFSIRDKFINDQYLELSEPYSQETTYTTIKNKHLEYPELSLIGMLFCDKEEYHEKYFLNTMESNKNLEIGNPFHKKLIDDIKGELFDHKIKKTLRRHLLQQSSDMFSYRDNFTMQAIELLVNQTGEYKKKNIELIFAMFHFECFSEEIKDPKNNELYFKLLEDKNYLTAFFNYIRKNKFLIETIEHKNPDFLLMYKTNLVVLTPFNLVNSLEEYAHEVNKNAERIKQISSYYFEECSIKDHIVDLDSTKGYMRKGRYNKDLVQNFKISVRLGDLSLVNDQLAYLP